MLHDTGHASFLTADTSLEVPALASVATHTEPWATHELEYARLQLQLPLRPDQIPQWRRFVNLFVGQHNDHFHNHQAPQRYHYRYPLVQYKVADRQATLFGYGAAGTAALRQLAEEPRFQTHCREWLGAGSYALAVHHEPLHLHSTLTRTYTLRQYIALNEANLRAWQTQPGLAARTALLERCLVGHLLKFASAIRWQLPPRALRVEVLDFSIRPVRGFDNPFLGFHVRFRSNLDLPNRVGLGKAVSHGFGVVERIGA